MTDSHATVHLTQSPSHSISSAPVSWTAALAPKQSADSDCTLKRTMLALLYAHLLLLGALRQKRSGCTGPVNLLDRMGKPKQ